MKIFEAKGFKFKEIIINEQCNFRATGYWKTNSVKYNFLLLAYEYLFVFRKGVIMGVIFVAGVYGVGKTTICDKLSLEIDVPHYSASDLITEYIGEIYGANKAVSNIDNNQRNLINAVKKVLETNKQIILSGHFCIFDKKMNVIALPQYVYEDLYIDKIILLENDVNIIIKNLNRRDNKTYLVENIINLKRAEEKASIDISQVLKVPMEKHKLNYDDTDLSILRDKIIGG